MLVGVLTSSSKKERAKPAMKPPPRVSRWWVVHEKNQLSNYTVGYFSFFRSISTNARMGIHKPLYCTGLGKAFLAFLPEEEREELLSGLELVPQTSHTITDPTVLRRELSRFRTQGFATDHEEIEEGLWCVAMPVYNYKGHMEAAVSISGPLNRMKPREAQLAEALGRATAEISKALGYSPARTGKAGE